MSDTSAPVGRCLCGEITFRLTGEISPVLHCHCENCRRVSGNFVAASRVLDVDIDLKDEASLLRWHDLSFARYGFCSACGSTLFFKAADTDHQTSVMVGPLEDAGSLPLGGVWFAGEAQSHHTLSSDAAHFDGNDVAEHDG